MAPCLIFFDEVDSLFPARRDEVTAQAAARAVGQFLSEVDGLADLRGIVVVAATNRPDLIDPAALRPGRFDLVVELPVPDRAAREEILRIHLDGKPLAPDVSLATNASDFGLAAASDVSLSLSTSFSAVSRPSRCPGACGCSGTEARRRRGSALSVHEGGGCSFSGSPRGIDGNTPSSAITYGTSRHARRMALSAVTRGIRCLSASHTYRAS